MHIRPDVQHISMGDFPRTGWSTSFGVRPALMKAFNYCRQYPDKMMSFKAILVYVLQRIQEWEVAASKCDWQPNDQRPPMVSRSLVHPALTIDEKGQLSKPVEVEQGEYNEVEATGTHQTSVHVQTAAQVAVVPPIPPMPNMNPLKPQVHNVPTEEVYAAEEPELVAPVIPVQVSEQPAQVLNEVAPTAQPAGLAAFLANKQA